MQGNKTDALLNRILHYVINERYKELNELVIEVAEYLQEKKHDPITSVAALYLLADRLLKSLEKSANDKSHAIKKPFKPVIVKSDD